MCRSKKPQKENKQHDDVIQKKMKFTLTLGLCTCKNLRSGFPGPSSQSVILIRLNTVCVQTFFLAEVSNPRER